MLLPLQREYPKIMTLSQIHALSICYNNVTERRVIMLSPLQREYLKI